MCSCIICDDNIVLQGQGTPLHWAAIKGHTDSVALLASRGANINMKDRVSYVVMSNNNT